MKKSFLAILLAVLLAAGAMGSAFAAADDESPSPPISSGVINKYTELLWGKNEMFPIIAYLNTGTKLDVYEYDADWVMVLYETGVHVGNTYSPQSFYGYVKRSDIDCDPALEGDASAKADTGPGKKKGKKPKPQNQESAAPDDSPAVPTDGQSAPPASDEPQPTLEQMEEYDWIIRTPGLCSVTVRIEEAVFTCSFALMAQKTGGTAASSDPMFNGNIHNPYAATVFFGMVANTQDMLDNMGVSGFLSGSGGIDITGQSPGAKFYIDTASFDPALVNFTVNLDANATFGVQITDGNITGDTGTTSVQSAFPLPVQLKKVGGGYKFILPGMKPGGGDLEFPAVLEKTFADPDRYDKEAQDADKRRAEAERLRQKVLEKIKEQMKREAEEASKAQQDGTTEKTDGMTVTGDDGEEIPLAPLVTPDPLAPLVSEDPLAPLVSEDPLAPLEPTSQDSAPAFPSGGK